MNGEEKIGSLIDLLDKLVDPVEPPPVSMMPQTWGWAVIAILILVAFVLAGLRSVRRYRANAYRRAALHALQTGRNDPQAIAAILRRAALAAYPRRDVAGLAGKDWLRFLDSRIGGEAFQAGAGQAVATAPYVSTAPDAALPALAERWIKYHRPEAAG